MGGMCFGGNESSHFANFGDDLLEGSFLKLRPGAGLMNSDWRKSEQKFAFCELFKVIKTYGSSMKILVVARMGAGEALARGI